MEGDVLGQELVEVDFLHGGWEVVEDQRQILVLCEGVEIGEGLLLGFGEVEPIYGRVSEVEREGEERGGAGEGEDEGVGLVGLA